MKITSEVDKPCQTQFFLPPQPPHFAPVRKATFFIMGGKTTLDKLFFPFAISFLTRVLKNILSRLKIFF